jgi:hypothetical protein
MKKRERIATHAICAGFTLIVLGLVLASLELLVSVAALLVGMIALTVGITLGTTSQSENQEIDTLLSSHKLVPQCEINRKLMLDTLGAVIILIEKELGTPRRIEEADRLARFIEDTRELKRDILTGHLKLIKNT